LEKIAPNFPSLGTSSAYFFQCLEKPPAALSNPWKKPQAF
jgi:hypothetical protein